MCVFVHPLKGFCLHVLLNPGRNQVFQVGWKTQALDKEGLEQVNKAYSEQIIRKWSQRDILLTDMVKDNILNIDLNCLYR